MDTMLPLVPPPWPQDVIRILKPSTSKSGSLRNEEEDGNERILMPSTSVSSPRNLAKCDSHQNKKAHRSGIKKPKKHVFLSMKGAEFLKKLGFANINSSIRQKAIRRRQEDSGINDDDDDLNTQV